MPARLLVPLLLSLLLGNLVGPPPAAAAVPVASPVSGVLGAGGGWCWFSDPRSVHLTVPTPRTLTGWIDADGRIVVSAYDHATRRTSWATVMTSFFVDDHNNPSLLAHPDGRVSVFWSGHNGDAIWVRTTTRPGDIRSFGPTRAVRTFAPGDRVVTYTNPVLLPGESGRILLFFRSGYSHQAFVASDDDGRTWGPATVLVEDGHHRPYVKYAGDGDRTVATAFTDGHPDERRSSVHYAALTDGVLSRADGTVVHRLADGPLRPSQGDLLWDGAATGVSGWVHDVALDAARRPVVVFATVRSRTDHRYHYARWDGARWTVQELGAAGGSINASGREPSYSGGIALDHADPSTLYLSRPAADPAVHEIERWTTPDGGTTWTAQALTSGSTTTNVRPVRPRGLPADSALQAVWMNGVYPHFTTFRTSLHGTAEVLPGAAAPSSVRVRTSSLSVPRGTDAVLRARLLDAAGVPVGDREVTLERRPPGLGTWKRVSEERTDADGHVVLRTPLERSAELRVSWPGDEQWLPSASPVLLVTTRRARTSLTGPAPTAVRAGQRFVVTARLADELGRPLAGRPVTLLGRRPGATAWTRLLPATTGPTGSVSVGRLLLQPTEYALRYDGEAELAPSSTVPVRLAPVRVPAPQTPLRAPLRRG